MFFILFPLCSLSSPYFSLSSFSFSVHYLALLFKFKKSFISMTVTVALLPKLCSGNTEGNCNSNFNHVNIHVCVYVTQTMCTPPSGLFAVLLMVLEWARPGLPAPLWPICDLRALDHFVKKAQEAEAAMVRHTHTNIHLCTFMYKEVVLITHMV